MPFKDPVKQATSKIRRKPYRLMGHDAKYPIDPLLRAMGGPVTTCAALLDVDQSQIYVWKREGLRWVVADELAIRAGFHPSEIWPEWVPDGLSPLDAHGMEAGRADRATWLHDFGLAS